MDLLPRVQHRGAGSAGSLQLSAPPGSSSATESHRVQGHALPGTVHPRHGARQRQGKAPLGAPRQGSRDPARSSLQSDLFPLQSLVTVSSHEDDDVGWQLPGSTVVLQTNHWLGAGRDSQEPGPDARTLFCKLKMFSSPVAGGHRKLRLGTGSSSEWLHFPGHWEELGPCPGMPLKGQTSQTARGLARLQARHPSLSRHSTLTPWTSMWRPLLLRLHICPQELSPSP